MALPRSAGDGQARPAGAREALSTSAVRARRCRRRPRTPLRASSASGTPCRPHHVIGHGMCAPDHDKPPLDFGVFVVHG
ncbi:hypothetical protein L3055_10815 [Corynebacterium sp. MC-02]|nr:MULTISPECIES: hypothetical protein [Corynebacterium]MCF7183993.1 hypothetical protein [Corynebacterium parakroppenstedtii]MCF8704029.1 hypothetical protein [Corynebacterium pseudokroppenstedtii]MCG2637545.1 hypothetical protein [Corynebacterium pseudokroppenstedtii]MCG2675546.1 hypothetical protein [Corynebacterium parakroppenstedtii]